MTYQEAINELKEEMAIYESDIVAIGDSTPDGQLLLSLQMGIEALKKQIPKKVINWCHCPSCDKNVYEMSDGYVPEGADAYCGFCGQRLDWSDVYKWT